MEHHLLHRFFGKSGIFYLVYIIIHSQQLVFSLSFFSGLEPPKLKPLTSTSLSTSEHFRSKIKEACDDLQPVFTPIRFTSFSRYYTAASSVPRPDLECLVRKAVYTVLCTPTIWSPSFNTWSSLLVNWQRIYLAYRGLHPALCFTIQTTDKYKAVISSRGR